MGLRSFIKRDTIQMRRRTVMNHILNCSYTRGGRVMVSDYVKVTLVDLLSLRETLKAQYNETITELKEGGCYDEAARLEAMGWEEIMTFEIEDME